MITTEILAAWIGIFLPFAILSYLYDDNPFYKLAEHLFVGTSIGYVVTLQYFQVIKPNLIDRLGNASLGAARAVYLVPLVLVVFLFMKLSRRWSWLGRIAVAFIIGIYAGQNIPAYGNSDLVAQVATTLRDVASIGVKSWPDVLGAFVLAIGTSAGLVYFYFSREHKGALGVVSRLGVLVLMVGFGASFGYTVQGRISLAIGRTLDVLGMDKPAAKAAAIHGPVVSIASIAIIVAGLVLWERRRRREGS